MSECQKRVNDLLDLQFSREGVITAMKSEVLFVMFFKFLLYN